MNLRQIRGWDYRECKPNHRRRMIWRLINSYIFPIVPMRTRKWLVRLFGVRGKFACHLYPSVRIFAPWNLEVGTWVCFGPDIELYNKGNIKIGNNVTISQGAYLCTATHDISSPTMDLICKPIVIGDNVWIASHATILPGVTIGEGAVVGACAVVTKDVEPWTVVGGNPARFIKKRVLRD